MIGETPAEHVVGAGRVAAGEDDVEPGDHGGERPDRADQSEDEEDREGENEAEAGLPAVVALKRRIDGGADRVSGSVLDAEWRPLVGLQVEEGVDTGDVVDDARVEVVEALWVVTRSDDRKPGQKRDEVRRDDEDAA